ncbi:AI-2E family transporter [Shimia marina]|uniref:Transport of quorum-sensing signal protein n=1 Tax=Shimia marina TaxID=321267 RepID=A0A0P1ERX1_9RHOB|nr:AI-2E family transporter [Shimia marina]CUH52826.1 Transport of quorum-sensing signal protein [Shimia marina]SFD88421.1 Predicted PurR-regulated permease PerM [Shimia marina]
MALPAHKQFQFWGIFIVVFALILWALGDVLLPFILGGAIAYFLDPLADRLEDSGLSRAASTAVITVLGLLIFVVGILAVVPSLISQATELVDTLPEVFAQLRTFVSERFPSLTQPDSVMSQTLHQIGTLLQERGGEVLQGALSSAMSLLNVLMLLVIAPVVAFYLLLDWDRMIAEIDRLLPRDHAPIIRRLAADIDKTLASFVRGMGTVCLILGTYYAVALMVVGLNFGLVVGFIAGLVTFIPYLGALIGGALAIGLALFQFWGEWFNIGLVAAIFMIGQMVEGNILTPKLVGKSVGLHPVWLLLALSVFGALFGFVGMLVAVPVAAAIGVLARFVTGQYMSSKLYRGLSEKESDSEI